MTVLPSNEYMVLATNLIDALDNRDTAPDSVLLQLQALFGPMLTSALQLVDKREVVRVSLPQGRFVYQVTASTGKPYTLHLDLPERIEHSEGECAIPQPAAPPDGPPDSPTLGITDNEDLIEVDADDPKQDEVAATRHDQREKAKRERLGRERQAMERMYCPCPGYAYNSLAGDKNVLCKHLLAAIIGWKTGRDLKTEVPLYGIASLLGIEDKVEYGVKTEVKQE